MATVYKVHPAIGIARVGNSPDEFFIGPERLGEELNPSGGFKDAQCRVKRQAARFRIFAHHDDGSWEEITHAEAEITWSVHLVNRKAAHPSRHNYEPRADLTIDPGARSVNAPNQRQLFDTGQIRFDGGPVTTVPLGEIRSDPDNHLLVLGSAGHSASPTGHALDGWFWSTEEWYDDVSDGPVAATIRLRADNSTPAVVGAWVIVAPPKFAPNLQSVITLYDRVLQTMVDGGLLTAPTTTSYTRDVQPILQRARDTRWVDRVGGSHTWADPVTNSAVATHIFNRLKTPGGGGGDMPDLDDGGTPDDRLTAIQYAHMERWKDGNYANDWAGLPPPEATVTPAGMDRAALDACVGGAFYPGIEAGGILETNRPILALANYAGPFRLDHGVVLPGIITFEMALPWQKDFWACGENWWPVPRPNFVIREGVPDQPFTAGVVNSGQEMVDSWHKLGFIVRQGSQYVEVERCDKVSIDLLTPVLNFLHVPQGPMGMVRETALSITFEVSSPGAPVTLEYAAGGAPAHAQLVPQGNSVTVGPTSTAGIATARLWIVYRTANPGDVLPPQTVTVRHAGGTQSWQVTIVGDTVARKKAAAALVLDRSGSMSENRGDNLSKHLSLQEAARVFVAAMLEEDGVGIVRFNENAQVLQNVLSLGNGGISDVNRNATKDIINGNGLDPGGLTSIGDGIFQGRAILNATTTPFDLKALVVLTDGVETASRYIADVAADINEHTYAVGLGQPQNISVSALQTVSGNNGGYLLVTGAIGADNRFLMQKYFLQILAGISNAEVVLDPDGHLLAGRVERVPFRLTSGDTGVDVILLTPNTKIVDFRVQTPSGQIIEPWRASSEPGMRYVQSDGVSYYRLALPVVSADAQFDSGGTWQALLTIGRPRDRRSEDSRDGSDPSILRAPRAAAGVRRAAAVRGRRAQRAGVLAAEGLASAEARAEVGTRSVPYSVVVHAYSNLSLSVHTEQASFEPGARVEVHASLAQSGIPLGGQAQVWADVTAPDATASTLTLTEASAGQFSAVLNTTRPGVYRLRIRARGASRHDEPFTREKTLTAAVWHGGDRPPATGGNGGADVQALLDYLRERDSKLCDLLGCLLQRGGVLSEEMEKQIQKAGLDLNRIRKCLSEFCKDSGKGCC